MAPFRALILASLCCAAPLAAQSRFPAQVLIVPTFHGPDRGQAHRAADLVRNRVADAFSRRELRVVSAGDVADWLEKSGFDEDSTFLPSEARDIARHFRADEQITGTVTRMATGVRVRAVLTVVRDSQMAQPLVAEAPTVDAAARAVGDEAVAARRQMLPLRRCENFARDGQLDSAAKAAAQGVAAYPRSTLARACLLRVLVRMPGNLTDSVIAVARAMLAASPADPIALEQLGLALDTRGAFADASQAWLRLLATDSLNASLLQQVVEALSREGNARLAEPIIVRGTDANPEDLPLLKLRWLVHLATGNWPAAIAAGERLEAQDAAARADPDFYLRLASAYRADSQPERALSTAAAGVASFRSDASLYSLYVQLLQSENATALPRGLSRFPDNADLHALAAQSLNAAGDVAGAAREMRVALAANPALPHGFLQLAVYDMALNAPDSALAALNGALAHGEGAATVAQFALARGNALYAAANGTKLRADFERAHRFLALAERLDPSAQAEFLLGASALSVGQYAANEAPAARRCDLSRLADSSLTEAAARLTSGRSAAPEAADQFLQYLGTLRPFVANQIKAFCPPGGTR
ncbi:MAG TPA: hypothetical protein VNE60_02530 [Gemmatimonadaceae bacterium]|nr:hypothetical protein [Gemmatimonadaceae bacterium]